MKIKIGDLEGFTYAVNLFCKLPLPRAISSRITDFVVKQLDDENKIVTRERIAICEKYTDRDDSGNPIILANNEYSIVKSRNEFNAEINEYFNQEIEFVFDPVKESDLGPNDKIAPEVLIILKKVGFLI